MVLSEFVKLALVELAVLLLLDLLHYTNQLTPEQSLLNVAHQSFVLDYNIKQQLQKVVYHYHD